MDSPLIANFGEEYSYFVESIKGPTDFNATNLPSGLEIDPSSGLIFGVPNEVGEFNSTIEISNISGSDSEVFKFVVLKGQQSITHNQDLGLVTYGMDPIDLNVTATSKLPVSLELIDGNHQFILVLTNILSPGTVKIKATQEGDQFWNRAEPIFIDIQVMKKELVVKIDNQFRKTNEPNPTFTYQMSGFANDDNESF